MRVIVVDLFCRDEIALWANLRGLDGAGTRIARLAARWKAGQIRPAASPNPGPRTFRRNATSDLTLGP
jgi:hypothetical protein